VLSATAAAGSSARAQSTTGEDTRLRLNQGIDRRSAETERQLLEGEDLVTLPSTIEIDGRTYTVSNDVNEMGQALYISIARRQWNDVRRFLNAYSALRDRDPMLVLYAKGALAREAGDIAAAEAHYRELLALQPDFLPARLELARALFESRKDRDALRAFRQLRTDLETQGDKAAGVRRTIDIFIQALEKRRGWQGSLAIGPGYSSNLNQSSASYTCLLIGPDGTCLFDRKVPDPIQAAGINFEGTLNRRVPLSGNGGLLGRALLYGDVYPGNGAYSQATLTTQIGYDYQARRGGYSISPTFDLASFGPDILYSAWGLRAEAMVAPTPNTAIRIEASRKVLDYRLRAYEDYDGALTEAYLTGWWASAHGLSLFGGPDFLDKTANHDENGYRQLGFRLGVNKQFGKAASLLAFTSLRWRDYRSYSELLEARRHDREQNFVATVKLPALRFAGLTPNILVQHTRVESNVDWLYSYKRTAASLRLEYAF
jgi:tetratricopeptide (TPR) repeat protein